jgi:hypothetical protein
MLVVTCSERSFPRAINSSAPGMLVRACGMPTCSVQRRMYSYVR